MVDDRAADRETLRAILEDNGYEVTEAEDGEQAISVAVAVERHHRAILMDIRMPNMDGLTAFEEIRTIDPQVKVIFITGYALEDCAREALLAGAYTVLNKSVNPDELLALVKSIAGQEVQ